MFTNGSTLETEEAFSSAREREQGTGSRKQGTGNGRAGNVPFFLACKLFLQGFGFS